MMKTWIACAFAFGLHVSGGPALAETMTVNGAELTYIEAGTGAPVLFVHGAISDSRVWLPLRDHISADRRFVAYDQRYFGPADWPDDGANFSRETHIADLIAFAEGLNAGPVDLVTWSYAGEIGVAAALQRPDLFRAMVHYEPALDQMTVGVPGAKRARGEWASSIGPAITAMKEGRAEDAALRFLELVFRMPEGAADDEPKPWPSIWRENGRTVAPFVSMAPGAAITCSDLSALEVPTLIVQGAQTYTRYAMMAERLADCLPKAELMTMEGVNHDGPYRKPDAFADAIAAFLAVQVAPTVD